jgi:hypothetical protein
MVTLPVRAVQINGDAAVPKPEAEPVTLVTDKVEGATTLPLIVNVCALVTCWIKKSNEKASSKSFFMMINLFFIYYFIYYCYCIEH